MNDDDDDDDADDDAKNRFKWILKKKYSI